jgi:hypothetical protein
VQKRSFFNKIGTNEAILTIDSALYSENLPLSKPRSADRQNFVLGTQSAKNGKKGVSAMKFELSHPQSADRPNFVLGDMKRQKVLNGNLSIDNTFYPTGCVLMKNCKYQW